MSDIKIAYFSAEIGVDEKIKTYSGGLGILAGDTIKAMSDLEVPACAVTLLYKHGYFKQQIDEKGDQVELEDDWDYGSILKDTKKKVKVNILGEDIHIKIWQYSQRGVNGFSVPIYYLDTALDENPLWSHKLTDSLYIGDRLGQEIILGIGGLRALEALGHNNIKKYHMNEGHSALLTLELYKLLGDKNQKWDDGSVKEMCVFTTHTPIPAGHDKFTYEEFYDKLKGEINLIPWHIKKLAGQNELNMTKLALSLSGYSNAVSKKHGEVTREIFPDYTIDSITNGIHAPTWVSPHLAKVYDSYIKGWREDSMKLKGIFKIPNSEIFKAHKASKDELIDYVNNNNSTGAKLNKDVLTIGFARRFVEYKDAELIFSNIRNLKRLGDRIQFIFSGKAHKKDGVGKSIIRRVIEHAKELSEDIQITFIEDYRIEIAKKLVSGCDMWLNTPIPFNEASGTSGMKAAVNGCLHFSRLDGWAIESFQMNGGGYPISEYHDFITNLEYKILPKFYSSNKESWINEMKLAIGNSGSYFNTHRMVTEYKERAYKI